MSAAPAGAAQSNVANMATNTAGNKKEPLFRAGRMANNLRENAMPRADVLAIIKRRAETASTPYSTCCHTFRATGITTYLQNGRTTQDHISVAEAERIRS
jgi:hypothetical protein